ncbi:MAG: hypothetical protein ACTSRP_09905 [Candidatus Helarchaeota archaeon]
MSKSREITPKWILVTFLVAIVLGFMIGIIRCFTNSTGKRTHCYHFSCNLCIFN